jgi:pimeloyl-ACP methyl ester carboxylesterase
VAEVTAGYEGEYKKLYSTNDGTAVMNIYEVGESNSTIVILPGYAVTSPVLEYKALADSLSSNFKVEIVEYLGYGYSNSTTDERTSENIINEIRQALASAKVSGPYILLSFSTSSIYANYYAQNFPDEVSGIISIDGMYADSLKNANYKEKYLPNLITNIKFYSVASYSGIFRWMTYLKPEAFNLDKMQSNSSYSSEDLKLYRTVLANKFLSKAMRNEISKLQDNMESVKNYTYSENLQTLQILTEDTIDEYSQREENIEKYAKNLITNKEIQKVVTLDGDLSDYLFEKSDIQALTILIKANF